MKNTFFMMGGDFYLRKRMALINVSFVMKDVDNLRDIKISISK